VHLIENLSALAFYLHAHALANLHQTAADGLESAVNLAHVNNHHHIEIPLHNSLRDVENVYFVLCQISANFCDNAHGVLAHHSNNSFIHCYVPFMFYYFACKVSAFYLFFQIFLSKHCDNSEKSCTFASAFAKILLSAL